MTVLSSCQRGTNICFLQRGPRVVLGNAETQALSRMFASGFRDALCGKRPGPRQQERTSQSWRQRAQNFCLQLETTGARYLGSRRMGNTKFVERTRALEIGAASVDAPHEGSKEANVRRGKSFAHAARQVVARVWCKFVSSAHSFTVITQLPVVPDDNPGLTMHFGSGAGVGRHNFPRQGSQRWPAIRHSAAGKARTLERGCASLPSFLTGTRDVGRAPSQAFPPRPGGLAQELWEGGGEQTCRCTASTVKRFCNLQMCPEQIVRGQPARPLAQTWDAQDDNDLFCGCKGKAYNRAAWGAFDAGHQSKKKRTRRQARCKITLYDNVGHATVCRM